MSAAKRLSLVRQFSLQCETSKAQQRKQSLKKQASEELADVRVQPEANIRISLSAKNRSAKIVDRPPPAKIAWVDKPPPTPKNNATEEESILNVRQDLTDRLRQVWKEKEQSKQNLDIFLTPNEDEDEKHSYDALETERSSAGEKTRRPKIILPLKPEVANENVKNVFQKRIRKAMKQKSIFGDGCYSPSNKNNNENKCSTIVVPVIDRKSIAASPSSIKSTDKEQEKAEDILAKQVVSNVIIRPSTAASKREMFQKRTNSAFQGSVKKDHFRPPLVRASSVPSKQPEQKPPKFLANKRRAKTAKAKLKCDASEDESDPPSGGRGRRMQRCVSVNGEIETMISLISPSGSDNEEEEEANEEEEEKVKPPDKPKIDEKLEGYREQQKNFSLRKTVKSVSFQQSSIHAVRSFSASFPARRCSVATALMLGNKTAALGKTTGGGGQKIQEKRAPVSVLEDEQSVPKRRLVRTKSAPSQQQQQQKSNDDEDEISSPENNNDSKNETSPSPQSKESSPDEKQDANETVPEGKKEEDATGSSEPKFENPKEKQCWDLYRKMSAKGVAISFDTILRGMLTPTEYRLRRKPSLVPEDNCEITGN